MKSLQATNDFTFSQSGVANRLRRGESVVPFFIAALAATAGDSSQTQRPTECVYDHSILDLSAQSFDQDMKGGWRALAKQSGCEKKAAEIIREYRAYYLARIPVLYWHEGQLRATIGEFKDAIPLMEQSKLPSRKDLFGWNFYVDATVAFLRNDRAGFLRAQKHLESLKRPDDWEGEWPQNRSVVTGLWSCFGRPYKVAYGSSCRLTDKQPVETGALPTKR